MHLTRLTLKHFRNHHDTSFDFGEGINVLLGDNGQGKTNVIEAISYLCLTKSFYAASDALVLSFGEPMFELEGTIQTDGGIARAVREQYQGGFFHQCRSTHHSADRAASRKIMLGVIAVAIGGQVLSKPICEKRLLSK